MNETIDIMRRWPGLVARHPVVTGSKAKLVALIIYAEAHWPSGTFTLHVTRIAKLADVETEYVRDIVEALVSLGLLYDTGRTDQRGRWVYRFALPERVAA